MDMINKRQREYIKYRLALQDKELRQLAEHLGLHRNGLYIKMNGTVPFKEVEKLKIKEYLGLSELEHKELWYIN